MLIGQRRVHPGGTVPGDLGQRLGQLLQPAIVGEAAVPDGRIGPEDDLEAGRRRCRWRGHDRGGRRRGRWRGCRFGCGRRGCGSGCARGGRSGGALGRRHERRGRAALRDRRAADEAVVQRVLPELVGARERLAFRVAERPAPLTREGARPVVLDDVERRATGLAGHGAEQLVGRVAFEDGRDQRLDHSDRAVVRPRVGVGDVPVAQVCRFVHVVPVVDAERHLRQSLGELDVRRGAENRVATDNHEEPDLPGVHGRRQIDERGGLILRRRFDRRAVAHRRADVAERLVDRVRDEVHGGRLVLAGDDERGAAMGLEILGDGGNPGGVVTAGRGSRRGDADGGRQLPRETLDVGGAHGQPVVCLCPGERRRALHRIHPAHRPAFVGHAAAVGEVARVADASRSGAQEVGVEREDDVRLVEVVDRLDRPAHRLARRGAGAVPGDRVVLMPARLWILLEDRRHELGKRWRGDRAAEDAKAGASRGLLLGKRGRQVGPEVRPGAELTAIGHCLGSIWVV